MGGSKSTTTYHERQLTPEERALIAQQSDYLRSIQPSIDKLVAKGTEAIDNTWTPDWGKMYDNTMTNINKINNGYERLAQGILPDAYVTAKDAYYRRRYENTLGKQLADLSRRGVVDSSRYNTVANDLQQNILGETSKDWHNNINTIANLLQNQKDNAVTGFGLAGQAQDNSFTPVKNYINLSQEQGGQINSALEAQGQMNNGRTTAVTTTKSSGLGSFLGAAIPTAASIWCFPEYVKVATECGDIRIADLEVGDVVISKDGVEKVLDLIVTENQEIITVATPNYEVDCTAGEVFVTREGRKSISDMELDEEILTETGFEPIVDILFTEERVTVYEPVLTGQNLFYANGICAEGFAEGELDATHSH